ARDRSIAGVPPVSGQSAYLASSAVSVTASPAASTSRPAPATVLQAATAKLANSAAMRTTLRILGSPRGFQTRSVRTPRAEPGSPDGLSGGAAGSTGNTSQAVTPPAQFRSAPE